VINPGNQDLYRISPQGDLVQLTDFSQKNLEWFSVQEPVWSPDGRYIAFILVDDLYFPLDNRFLYILDTQTGVATDACFPGPVGYGKAWSPDSRQLAFNIIQKGEERLIVFDLASGEYQYLENVEVVFGWSPVMIEE
jgi:Tol biopolymer transport system component